MAEYVKVATTDEVAPGQPKLVEVNGRRVALFNLDGNFYAIDDFCTHRGAPLSEGEVMGKDIQCPWHGAMFDITTGEVSGPPADVGVERFNVRVAGSDIEVEI
jgi:nitrite reductase/ring-hydroxylating ferredoxin subunit